MLLSLVTESNKWQHWASGALSSVTLYLFIFQLIPRQDFLTSIVKTHVLADNMKEAEAAQEVIKLGHAVIAAITLTVLMLQISAAKVGKTVAKQA
jgi:hypothetical protein